MTATASPNTARNGHATNATGNNVSLYANVLAGVGSGALRSLITAAIGDPRDFVAPPEYLVPDVSRTVAKLVLGQLPLVIPTPRRPAQPAAEETT